MTMEEFTMFAAAVANMPCVRIATKQPDGGQTVEVYVHMRTLLGVLRSAALAGEPQQGPPAIAVPDLGLVKKLTERN